MLRISTTSFGGDPNVSADKPQLNVEKSAVHRTLRVFELVENILILLDPHEILQAHAVCRYWHDVIGGSYAFKKRAFLVPDQQVLGFVAKEGRHGLPSCGISCVMVDPDNKFYSFNVPRVRPHDLPNPKDSWVEGTYNKSLLKPERPCAIHQQSELDQLFDVFHDWMSLDADLVKQCRYRYRKVKLDGGYPNMLLCQPTPTSAHIRVTFRHPAGNANWRTYEVRRASGIRLRDVADAINVQDPGRETRRQMKNTYAENIHEVWVMLKNGSQDDERNIVFVRKESEKMRYARLTEDENGEREESSTESEA